MPYITREQREELDPLIEVLANILNKHDVGPEVKGEYNYVITKLLHNYIEENGLRYHHLNDVVGIMECAKAEFIRTVISPYEDLKAEQNGYISDCDNPRVWKGNLTGRKE